MSRGQAGLGSERTDGCCKFTLVILFCPKKMRNGNFVGCPKENWAGMQGKVDLSKCG